MRRKIIALIALVPLLASCNKTNELYGGYAYNSPDFMENYFVEHHGVNELKVAEAKSANLSANFGYVSSNSLKGVRSEDNPENYTWMEYDEANYNKEYGRNHNLTKTDESFAYGYLSKLYDGRVRCEGKFQLSRVQLDRNGYSTFFPKKLYDYKFFAFSLRGATDYENTRSNPSPLSGKVYVDIHITFYQHITNSDQYNTLTFNLADVEIPCDNGGDTNLVTIYLANDYQTESGQVERYYQYLLQDTVAMTFTYELKTTRADLTDDIKVENDHHFAVMLYEVMFPNSVWR